MAAQERLDGGARNSATGEGNLALPAAASGRYARENVLVGVGGSADHVVSAPLAGGGFVLIWIGQGAVNAQLFDSAGSPRGAAFQVSSSPGASSLSPSVAGLPGGGFAVAWTIEAGAGNGDGSGRAVLAQAFDSAGARLGPETLVNAAAAGDQLNPRVSALLSGGYAVAWDDPGGKAVRTQLFGPDGGKAGTEINIVTDSAAAPAVTDVALLADGRLLATFEVASGTNTILKGQIIGAGGALSGPAFELDPLRGTKGDASIAPIEDGGFLLVWTRAAGDSSGSGVFAARYDSSGTLIGVPFPVNTTVAGEQTNASVRALPEGGFVVTWTSAAGSAASTGELRAQLLDSAGGKVGAEFRVASGALPLGGSIAPLADGGFAVAYDAGGAAAQIFTPATHSDIELSLSRSTLSEASMANVAVATLAPSAGASVGAAYRYAIVSDSSGGAFQLVGDRLYVVDSSKLDYETQPNLALTVRVTDDSGQSVDRVLSLQLVDAPGLEPRYTAGSQFALSASTSPQSGSSQAALAGGGFVAVWTGNDGAGFGARAQLFDDSGNKVGTEIAVNTATAGSQSNVKVAALGTGFVVSWTDIPTNGDGSQAEVEAQIFDSSGAKLGGEFVVNTTTAGAQNGSDIDSLVGGGFVVVWADASATGGDTDLRAVRAQRFDGSGAKIGGELLVNTTTVGGQFGASVAGLAGGGFVVSWTDQGGSAVDTDGTALHAQIFDSAGAKVGGEILVPTQTAGTQAVSSVVALASGNFVVVWHSNDNGTDFSIKAQMFDSAGARIGGEFRVETTTIGDQGNVAATALAGGGFAISWEDFGKGTVAGAAAIVAQLFDPAGNKAGDEFVVNPLFSGTQARTSGLTALASGDLVTSWTDGSKVYGRLFETGGAPPSAGADSYATDETRAVWGRLAHAGDGAVTEVNGVAASVGERIVLQSGAALVLRSDGSFAYDPNGAFGYLVSAVPTNPYNSAYYLSATDSFTYTAGGNVHEAIVTIAGVKSSDDTYYGPGSTIASTTGAERMMGGTGSDNYTVNHVGDVVIELPDDSEGPGSWGDFVSTTLLYYALPDNVEHLTYTGSGNATLVGNALDNRLTGAAGSDLLYGGGGNDIFVMYGGSDTAIGGSGDDIFNLSTSYYSSGTTVQTIVGGGGNDRLRLEASDSAPAGILLTTGGPMITGWTASDGSFVNLSQRIDATGISNIEILTGHGDTYGRYVLLLHDEFTPAGTTLTITATGLYDGEKLTIPASTNLETDAHLHVTGGNGADDITGGALADVLRGGEGNDRLDGGRGDDSIDGQGGDDSLYATATGANGGTKTVVGGYGTDRLYVSFGAGGPGLQSQVAVTGPYAWSPTSAGWIDDGAGNRVNFTDIEALTVTGSDAADQLAGTGGQDVLDGRGGADLMAGGAGDDRYYVDSLDDIVVELQSSDGVAGDEIHTALAAYTLPAYVEKLVGTSAAGQALTGNSLFNTITGGVGNDVLDGGAGGGSDMLIGGKGNDIYLVDHASDTVQELASEGTDEVRTTLASYTLAANVEKLTGTAATAQTLRGNNLANTIVGGASNDRLEGMVGNDTLDGGAGADTMVGGSGNDAYFVDDAGDVVTEIAGEGTSDEVRTSLALYALTANVENLTGTNVAGQTLTGNGSANVITGAAGDDVIDGGIGADTMRGGGGSDLYFVDSADVVTELAGEGIDEVRTALATYVLALNVENLTATSDTAHDFRGNGGNNVVAGGAGNDFIRLQDGGDDTAAGALGNDVFLFGAALTGADKVDGGSGTDQIAIQGDYWGGKALTLGSNFVSVENIAILPGNDTRFGDAGTSFYDYSITVLDSAVAAGVLLTVDANRLRAGEDFTFNGSAETDGSFFIYGGGGIDRLIGGAKNDVFIFGGQGQFGSGDFVIGGAGIDQLALRGNYTITFGAGQLVGVEQIGMVSAQDTRYGVLGSVYNYDLTMVDANVDSIQMTVDASPLRTGETLKFDGSAEDDGSFRVFGGRDNDSIVGSQNADLIQGNGGADTLTGGQGADVFRYFSASDSTSSATDRILDFAAGSDRIDLGRIDADTQTAGDQAFAWIGSNAFSGSAGQLRAYQEGGNWVVQGDTDGNGVADLVIEVVGPAPLGADAFLL
jgi:Ca2+-binding RTX toxin-like protein